LHEAVGLSLAEVVRLQRNAIEIAWLPVGVRDQLTAELDCYIESAL
jgi:adenosine deaminase